MASIFAGFSGRRARIVVIDVVGCGFGDGRMEKGVIVLRCSGLHAVI